MDELLLKNTYYALRHGRSTANESGLIVSHPENGVSGYGLSETGRQDTEERLGRGWKELSASGEWICFSSDFARAVQTAEVFCTVAELDGVRIDARLRERNFGSLELKSHENYEKVWRVDQGSPDHHAYGCESTGDVRMRLLSFVTDCELQFEGASIVASSHGDPLQIFQTIFENKPPNQHRSLPHLENAELRMVGQPGIVLKLR